MQQVPLAPKVSLEIGKRYLKESRSFLLPRSQRFQSLMVAWLYSDLARKDLKSWVYAPSVPLYESDPKVKISHNLITPGKPVQKENYDFSDLGKIWDWLTNGRDGLSPEELFKTGWHFDQFERIIRDRISWDEVFIRSVEDPLLA